MSSSGGPDVSANTLETEGEAACRDGRGNGASRKKGSYGRGQAAAYVIIASPLAEKEIQGHFASRGKENRWRPIRPLPHFRATWNPPSLVKTDTSNDKHLRWIGNMLSTKKYQ